MAFVLFSIINYPFGKYSAQRSEKTVRYYIGTYLRRNVNAIMPQSFAPERMFTTSHCVHWFYIVALRITVREISA